MPGHGLTGAVPGSDYSQEGMAKFVEETADALGLRRFAIVGSFMGGRVAVIFAANRPERLTRLVLVDAGGIPSKQPEQTTLAFRIARTPVLNRVMLHITPRSLVIDGLNEAIARKEILSAEMIDAHWDFIRMEGTRAATIARLN